MRAKTKANLKPESKIKLVWNACERERERERERKTETETERDRDRETETETETERQRQRQRQRELSGMKSVTAMKATTKSSKATASREIYVKYI